MVEVIGLVERVAGIDPACHDRELLCRALGSAARLRCWLDGQDVRLAGQLAEVESFPEQALAESARTSLRDAGRVLERVGTVEAIPALGEALISGAVSAGHVRKLQAAPRRL